MKGAFAIFALFVGSALSQEILEVTCGQDAIEARFNKQTLAAAEYQMSELHFNDPECLFDGEDGEYYVKRIEPISSCGTDVIVNNTHAKYVNSISSGEIETGLTFPHGIIVGQPRNKKLISVSYECTYKIDIRVSTSFIPNITIVKIPIPDAIGDGEFQVGMAIYKDGTYNELKAPDGSVPILQPDETIYVGIAMIGDTTEDVYILMRRCWATPNEDPDSKPYYPLITDKCPEKGAVQGSLEVTQNGIAQQALWRAKVFRFIGKEDAYQNVWLHCDLTLCIQETCQPKCDARRKRRSTFDDSAEHIITIKLQRGKSLHAHVNADGEATVRVRNETVEQFEERTIGKLEERVFGKHGKKIAANQQQWYENRNLLIGIGVVAAFCVLCLTIALVAVLMRLKRNDRTPSGEVTPTGTINKGYSI